MMFSLGHDDLTLGIYNTNTDELVTQLGSRPKRFTTDQLPGLLTLAATLPPGSRVVGLVGSMELTFTDASGATFSRTENVEPYAVFGDKNGDFFDGIPLTEGSYSLEVTVFSEKNGQGDELGRRWYAFDIDSPPIELSLFAFTPRDDHIPEDLGYSRAEITNTGVTHTLAGNDSVIGTSLSNSSTFTTGAGSDTVSGGGAGYYGLTNTGTINTGSDDDTVRGGDIGYDNGGISNSGLINTGSGDDTIIGIGYGDHFLGISNGGVIKTGAGRDFITGAGADHGISNSGIINMGSGRDVFDGVNDGRSGGYDGGGLVKLGSGDDIVKGAGDHRLDGGSGRDTLLFQAGAYELSSRKDGGGFYRISSESFYGVMRVKDFEWIGGLNASSETFRFSSVIGETFTLA